jgi:ssDNA-binding Zn-finger/Zn-ribbon topoisomerase 1
MRSHVTAKGATFLTCSKYPACGVSGTPDLLGLLEKPPEPLRGPVHISESIVGVAQFAIHLSKLRRAKTAEERETIRKQALEAIR